MLFRSSNTVPNDDATMTKRSRLGSSGMSVVDVAMVFPSTPVIGGECVAGQESGQAGVCRFPILAIERLCHRQQVVTNVQATPVYTPAIRVRARLIKTLDAAMPAKEMLGSARPKAIGGEHIRAAVQREIRVRHDQMQITGARAHRAIAVEEFHRCGTFKMKAHCAAMAPARDVHSTVTDLARLRG